MKEYQVSKRRNRTINDGAGYDAATSIQTAAEQRAAELAQTYEESSMQVMGDLIHLIADIPLGLERNPVEKKPDMTDDFSSDIKRDVLMQMQRTSKVVAQEELDDHEAEQAFNMKMQVQPSFLGGRLRNTLTELMSDVAKMKRGRVNHLITTIECIDSSVAAAELAAEQDFRGASP